MSTSIGRILQEMLKQVKALKFEQGRFPSQFNHTVTKTEMEVDKEAEAAWNLVPTHNRNFSSHHSQDPGGSAF